MGWPGGWVMVDQTEQAGSFLISLLTCLTFFLPALATFLNQVKKLVRRDDHQDERLDLILEALLRRGRAEGKRRSLLVEVPEDKKMPTVMSLEARTAFAPIAPALRKLRMSLTQPVNRARLAEAIEKQYGEWISKHICAVLGITNFACWDLACLTAEEDETPPDQSPSASLPSGGNPS